MDDERLIIIKMYDEVDVYFRNPGENYRANNQPLELEKMVQLLTNEEFENDDGRKKYKRRLKHPERFEVLELKFPFHRIEDDEDDENDDTDTYKCICTENSCKCLYIIRYKPTNTHFALGSICYQRFSSQSEEEFYLKFTAKKCKDCKTPLVYKIGKYIRNTGKKCDGRCYDCFEKEEERIREDINKRLKKDKRIYLNVSYADKDDAKSLGAWWDVENKKWYAPNNHSKFKALIDKYA